MTGKRIPAMIIAIALVLASLAGTGRDSVAKEASVLKFKQVDAGYGTVGGVEGDTYYVTLWWQATGSYYDLVQLVYDGTETEKKIGSGLTHLESGEDQFGAIVTGLKPGKRYDFRVYEVDADGNRLPDVKKKTLTGVKTLPVTPKKLKLANWYENLNESEFTWKADAGTEGYELRFEDHEGKEIQTKTVKATAASGAAAGLYSMKKNIRGQVVRLRVRSFVKVNKVKKYSTDWSNVCSYAVAKKVKMSGYKDAIKISGIDVSGATKKEIYLSTKKKKGYQLAATLGKKKTSCKVTSFGKKLVQSDKTYYVRIIYYYKEGKTEVKSPVDNTGRVYVKPTYFNLKVE